MSSTKSTLRLRVFAGPNGSGKSTIIKAVKDYRVKNIPVDFGIYVNADDIARALLDNTFTFKPYKIEFNPSDFVSIALASGLVNKQFTEQEFRQSFTWNTALFKLTSPKYVDRLAQILADFLRKTLLV